jgi:predicted DCC family thiol-disulfide oxidoreductase YuxK
MAWAVRHDRDQVLVTVPIQSSLGSELLADVAPGERLRAAHVIGDDGHRGSGGDGAAAVLGALPATRTLGRLALSLPGTTALVYGVVAARRTSFGRLVGKEARRRADDLLAATSVTDAEELSRLDRRPNELGVRRR